MRQFVVVAIQGVEACLRDRADRKRLRSSAQLDLTSRTCLSSKRRDPCSGVHGACPKQEKVGLLLRQSDDLAAVLYPGEYRRPLDAETLTAPEVYLLLARNEHGVAVELLVAAIVNGFEIFDIEST